MKAHEAERLIATIRELIDGETSPKGKAPHVLPSSPALKILNRGEKGVDVGPSMAALHEAAAGKAHPMEAIEAGETSNGRVRLTTEVLEAIYHQFRNRMIDDLRVDPIFLQLLASQPELEVLIQPQTVQLDTSTMRGRAARLIAIGFFDSAKGTGAARQELKRTGADPGGGGTLKGILDNFVRDGFLVREGDGYRKAPGIKVTERRLDS